MAEQEKSFVLQGGDMLVQAADDPETASTTTLHGATAGTWLARYSEVDTDDTYAILTVILDGIDAQTVAWQDTGKTVISDVNVICVMQKSKFPATTTYDPWWNSVVDSLSGNSIAAVDGGVVVSGTDGALYPIYECRQAGKLVGVRVDFPQA